MLWWFCSQSSIRDIGTELMWLICKRECYFTWLMFIILNLFMAQLFKFTYHGRYQNCQTLRLASSRVYICTFINSTKRQRHMRSSASSLPRKKHPALLQSLVICTSSNFSAASSQALQARTSFLLFVRLGQLLFVNKVFVYSGKLWYQILLLQSTGMKN